MDIVIQSDGLVAVRDGAYSLFDKGKALEELTPIQGLKVKAGRENLDTFVRAKLTTFLITLSDFLE